MAKFEAASSSFRPSSASVSANAGRQLPQVPVEERIPSVPGYAKPYARPFDPPPSPPPSPPISDKTTPKPLETNFDGDGPSRDTLNRSRSRSVGQILETNFDDPEPAIMPASGVSRMNNGHSRSMEGPQLAKLSLTPQQLLETGL